MFRSIRWTLLSWYALVLLLLLGAFGAALHHRLRRSAEKGVDASLRVLAQTLAVGLRAEDGRVEVLLLPEVRSQLAAPYQFSVRAPDGTLLEGVDVRKGSSRKQRAVTISGAGGAVVTVARSMKDHRDRLRETLGAVAGAGAGVLLLALAGGWLIASRTLAPVLRMSKDAEGVSASNLSQRLDVARAPAELAGLARALNGAFDRLAQAFERQTRFTADASHELRTPLAVVLAEAELALRKERGAAEYRETLGGILSAGRRMQAVVEGLLTLARSDAREGPPLRRERVDLAALVKETFDHLGPLASSRSVKLRARLEPAEVEGDRDRLREAVANLVTNAIRYNREGGTVDVSLDRGPEGGVTLAVADTGIGIPEADQGRVFERFYRADPARSREAGGSGLGLSITRWIVEAHRGTIAFTSREGEGTRFTVVLPEC